MISIQGQIYVRADLGDELDFLNWGNLRSLAVIEQAGNIPPSFELVLSLNGDQEVLVSKLNEGNRLRLTLGEEVGRSQDFDLMIISSRSVKTGNELGVVRVVGTGYSIGYSIDSKCEILSEMSSVDAIKRVGGEYLKVISDASSTDDTQKWIRPGISARKFVEDIWMDSFIKDSVLLLGITGEEKIRIRDLKTVSNEVKWKFSFEEREGYARYESRPVLDQSSGLYNMLWGYPIRENYLDLDSSEVGVFRTSKGLFQTTNKVHLRSDQVDERNEEESIVSENTHRNYGGARARNLNLLALSSSSSIIIELSGGYRDIHVLDGVEVVAPSSDGIDEIQSGHYIVSKVAINVINNEIKYILKLDRESTNLLVGGLQ